MSSTGYSNVGNYQIGWSFLSSDSTINDLNTATGATSSTSPPNSVTAGLDLGSSGSITDISFTVGYQDNTPSVALEWSTNSTTWSTTGMPTLTPPSHGGTFSLWSPAFSGLSITARYLRLSIQDASGNCSVREIACTGSSNTASLVAAIVSRATLGATFVAKRPLSAAIAGRGALGSILTIGYAPIRSLTAAITGAGILGATPNYKAPLFAAMSGSAFLSTKIAPPILAPITGRGTLSATITTFFRSASADYSVTGPTSLSVGTLATFTVVRLQAGAAANVTASTASPGTLSGSHMALPSFGSGSVTFTFTPAMLGSATISFTNSGGLADPASITLPVGSSTAGLPSACGPETTNHTDYVVTAGNLPLTFAPGDTKAVTFSVPDMPAARSIFQWRFSRVAIVPDNNGNINLPYHLEMKPFSEADTNPFGTNTISVQSINDGTYGNENYRSYVWPLMPIVDNPNGTATFYLTNNSAVSLTLNTMEISYTTYDCQFRSWSAASFNDTHLLFAWLSTKGSNNLVKTVQHRSIRANAGMPSTGWEAADIIEPGVCSSVGAAFLQSGIAFLTYTHNTYPFTMISQVMGAEGHWQDRQPPMHLYWGNGGASYLPYLPMEVPGTIESSGRTDHMAYVFNGGLRVCGYLDGETWYPVFRSRFGPGQWIGNGFTCLEPNNASPHGAGLYSAKCTDGVGHIWALTFQSALPTTYIPSGMVRLNNGTLVTLLFDPATGRSWGAWSRDKGDTWSIAGHFTETIPQLEIGPALTSLGEMAVACWVEADDNPQFAVSVDGGANWDNV